MDVIELLERSLELASAHAGQGRSKECEDVCRQMLRVDPSNLGANCLLSCLLEALGRHDESEHFAQAAKKSSEMCVFHNFMGISNMHLRENEKAMEHFAAAMEEDKDGEDPPYNMASCLMNAGNPERALHFFEEAYRRSGSSRSMVGMACCRAETLDLEESIRLLKSVLEREPENTAAKTNLSSVLHLYGEWEEAWKYHPSRLEHYGNLRAKIRSLGIPIWKEGDPPGSILVFSEQGLGDAINFWRFIPEIENKFPGTRVGLMVPDSLRPMLAKQGLNVSESRDGYEACCSMMDLPSLLGMTKEEVKASFRKINTDSCCDMSSFGSMFKIGICWAGNPAHPKDMQRSCGLWEFMPLFGLGGVKFFGIQKDLRPRVWPNSNKPMDLCSAPEGMRMVNMSPHMKSWEDTAAIISSLDLVISVDTSVMHMSAALGKETWGLIPYVPDWRWGLESDRTHWYPTLRLFRQPKRGDWKGVFSAVVKALREKLDHPKH